MGFGSSHKDDHATDSETESQRSQSRRGWSSTTTTKSRSSSGTRRVPLEETEARFGMNVPDRNTATRLQRLAASNTTRRVCGWVEEGMTVEDMGDPRAIQQFRQRQQERPAEFPTNIERQNRHSVQRSQQAAADTGPAGETKVPKPVRDVISSTGQSLDASIQRTMEDKMGDSFGDVQIHTGPQAAAACESINARAFTVGNHIAFNTGEYDPGSAEGQHVLAHELAHVRQQTGGAVSLLPQEDLELEIDPDPALEREAEETAQRVVQGWKADIQRMPYTGVHIQRWKNQPRKPDGRFDFKNNEEYSDKKYSIDHRPPYAEGQIREVWERAKQESPDGVVRDPNKPSIILEPEHGDWHMGHKEGREYRYLLEYYLRDMISEEEFIKEYQNPDHYQPEAPSENMSRKHEGEGEYWEREKNWGEL